MDSFIARRTFWTRLADRLYWIGRRGPVWFQVLMQADATLWALKHTKRQWFNGRHWVDRI